MTTRRRDFKRSQLSAALLATLVMSAGGAAFAQDATGSDQDEVQAASAEGATTLDRVQVTGSRIKRAEIEGPAPITVITRQDLEREGHVTVFDALESLTQNSTNVQGEMYAGGFTPNASVINLRGIGPGYTLFLLNGRRMAEYPQPYNSQSNFVNVAAIPSAMVERIEVLAGGASAIYGSDAVAGVVNVVLRENMEGDAVRLMAGTTTMGGGDTGHIQWTGGKSGERWSVVYAFEHMEREPIFGTQRSFIDSVYDGPNENPGPSLALVALDLVGAVGPTGAAAYYPGAEVCDRFGYRTFDSATRGRICGPDDDAALQTIRNKSSNSSAYLYGTFDFDNGSQFWASAFGWDSEAISSGGTEWWGNTVDVHSDLFYEPTLGTIVQLQRIFRPEEYGGLDKVASEYSERATELAAGFRGTFGERFDWDATVAQSRYKYENDRPRLLAKSVHDLFLTRVPGADPFFGAYPVFDLNFDAWHRPLTPQEYEAMSTRVVNRGESKATTASFTVSGDLFELPAGAVGFASVLEWASQEYDLNADPRILPTYPTTAPDKPLNLTGTGGGGERDRYAIGLELSIPIVETLRATVAGRYDKYDDITAVDGASTWQAGLEWRPLDRLLVRANYGTSFRAPDMHYVFAEQSGSFATVMDEYVCRAAGRSVSECNVSATAQANELYSAFGIREGNPDLKEETGKSWTAGFVLDLIEGMSVSADYYSIELEDQVGDITTAWILQQEADCRLGVKRDGSPSDFALDSSFCQDIMARITRTDAPGTPSDQRISQVVRGPTNRAYREVEGIDATFRYRTTTDRWGSFDTQLAYSHILSSETQERFDTPLVNWRDHMQNFEHRSRVRGAVTWQYNDWTTTLFGLRYGSIPNWAEDSRLQPFITYNFNIGKKITNDLKITLLVNNVLNNTHIKDDTHTAWPYFNYWGGQSPIGREVFVQMDYRFR